MNEDRATQAALPKLYGAPAYARPPRATINPVERPFDPDDLPIEAERSHEDKELVQQLQPHPYEAVVATSAPPSHAESQRMRAQKFRLRLPGRTR